MKDTSQSANVYCEAKDRNVEVKIVESGHWYNRHRKLVSCPALNDAGDTCDYACLKPKPAPWGNQHLARRITFYS